MGWTVAYSVESKDILTASSPELKALSKFGLKVPEDLNTYSPKIGDAVVGVNVLDHDQLAKDLEAIVKNSDVLLNEAKKVVPDKAPAVQTSIKTNLPKQKPN